MGNSTSCTKKSTTNDPRKAKGSMISNQSTKRNQIDLDKYLN